MAYKAYVQVNRKVARSLMKEVLKAMALKARISTLEAEIKGLKQEIAGHDALQAIVHRRLMWLNKIWQKEDWPARRLVWCDLGKLVEWAWAKRCRCKVPRGHITAKVYRPRAPRLKVVDDTLTRGGEGRE